MMIEPFDCNSDIQWWRMERFRNRIGCPLWYYCKRHECLLEAMQYGSCLWSTKVCAALYDLWRSGLVRTNVFRNKPVTGWI